MMLASKLTRAEWYFTVLQASYEGYSQVDSEDGKISGHRGSCCDRPTLKD
jgi:hypothetical protein